MSEAEPGFGCAWPRKLAGRRAALACGIACTALAAIGTAATSGPAAAAPAKQTAACAAPPQSSTSDGSPSAGLLARLGVLRRTETSGDALPASGPGSGIPPLGRGIYVRFIRKARVVAGTTYYVVPVEKAPEARGCGSSQQVFLVEVTASYRADSGATAREIARGGRLSALGSPGRWVLAGIVPDGVAKVSLRYAPAAPDRRERTLSATPLSNVFVAVLPTLPKSIVWHSASGSVIRTVRPESR